MTIVESRLKEGTLLLGTAPTEFDISCQLTNVRYTASYSDDGDAIEVLCGDKQAAGEKADGGTLAGTFIQDWTAPTDTSAILYLMANDLQEVDYSYTPNAESATFSGRLRLKLPGEFLGGDINTRLTSDFEWVITSWPPTITPPVVGTAASTSTSSSA